VNRGDIYLVRRPKAASGDPKSQRPFVIVSRQALVETSFPTVICAPIATRYLGLATQVHVGDEAGLKHALV
jgi:mRNA interferase MazF